MNASDPSVLVYCFSFIALMLSYYLLILSWCCVFGELLRREKFSQSDSACLTDCFVHAALLRDTWLRTCGVEDTGCILM